MNRRSVGQTHVALLKYVALMLLSADLDYGRDDAMRFLGLMSSGHGSVWPKAFWSVIGKCREDDLGPDLFDLFWESVEALRDPRTLKMTLSTMSRYGHAECERLAAVLCWTIAVRRGISWSDVARLQDMKKHELDNLCDRFVKQYLAAGSDESPRAKWGRTLVSAYERMFRAIYPFVGVRVKECIDKARGAFQMNTGAGIVRMIWKAFPDYQPMLLNGLISNDAELADVCIDRLRFVSSAAGQVIYILRQLINSLPSVPRGLKVSMAWLEERQRVRR